MDTLNFCNICHCSQLRSDNEFRAYQFYLDKIPDIQFCYFVVHESKSQYYFDSFSTICKYRLLIPKWFKISKNLYDNLYKLCLRFLSSKGFEKLSLEDIYFCHA